MPTSIEQTPPAGVLDLLARRRSSRAFSPRPLPEDVVESLVDAARWAPSYGNRQPWRFVVVQQREALERLHTTLTRGNAYAKVAPLLIAVCAHPDDGQTVDGKEYYLLDCGLALENLMLQAIGLGLHAHAMGGFSEHGAREALGIPSAVRVVALCVIGYPGDVAELDERNQAAEARPRVRFPVDDVRAWDSWTWPDHAEPSDLDEMVVAPGVPARP